MPLQSYVTITLPHTTAEVSKTNAKMPKNELPQVARDE